MNEKLKLITFGFLGTLFICAMTTVLLGTGMYLLDGSSLDGNTPVQATISPDKIPTRLPNATQTGAALPEELPEEIPPRVTTGTELDDLASIAVLPFTYDDNEDEIDEGVAIDLVFYNANDEVISFEDVPIEITLEFYAYTDIAEAFTSPEGDLIYTKTVTRDHSATLEEMLDNYIRIPYTEMDVDPDQYVRFGMVRASFDAANEHFEASSTLVMLYPEQ